MLAPGASNPGLRLITMFSRPGSGLPSDSQVRRPMITGWPSVSFLKCRRSSGRCHGSLPPAPITPFFATAATR